MAKKLAVKKEIIHWNDRKRVLGLPLSFTKYSVSEERLILRQGFFKTQVDELLIYRIMDIKMTRTLGQKIFGVGTITLFSTDKTQPKLDLINIKRPDNVRKFLSALIERQRKERGVTGSEFLGTGRPGRGHGGGGHGHFHDDG